MFLLCTHPSIPDLYSHLQHVYSEIYVDCIARNPLYQHKLNETITCPLFIAKVEEYLLAVTTSSKAK